jgi:chorismate mutase
MAVTLRGGLRLLRTDFAGVTAISSVGQRRRSLESSPVAVRAVRGATTLDFDTQAHLFERMAELLDILMTSNELVPDDLISVLVTASADVRSGHPATALRASGLTDVPLMGALELDLPGMLPLCLRVMFHVDTERSRSDVQHIFLHGAVALRPDLAARNPGGTAK